MPTSASQNRVHLPLRSANPIKRVSPGRLRPERIYRRFPADDDPGFVNLAHQRGVLFSGCNSRQPPLLSAWFPPALISLGSWRDRGSQGVGGFAGCRVVHCGVRQGSSLCLGRCACSSVFLSHFSLPRTLAHRANPSSCKPARCLDSSADVLKQ